MAGAIKAAVFVGLLTALLSVVASHLLGAALRAEHDMRPADDFSLGPLTLLAMLWGAGGYASAAIAERRSGVAGGPILIAVVLSAALCLCIDAAGTLLFNDATVARYACERFVCVFVWVLGATRRMYM
jgi:hypothetical protein